MHTRTLAAISLLASLLVGGCQTREQADPRATTLSVGATGSGDLTASNTGAMPASPAAPAPAARPDRPHATMTTIHLPGHPDMTPEQYAAWWAGVPVERLELAGPDKVLLPPELKPPHGSVKREWRVAPHADGSAGRSAPERLSVLLPGGAAWAFWPHAADGTGQEPAPVENALAMAREFMGARGFAEASLEAAKVHPYSTRRDGTPLLVCVTFESPVGTDSSARLDVSLTARAITSATLTLPRPVPPPDWRQPEITLAEARTAVKAELKRRGVAKYEIALEGPLHCPPWQRPDNPLYCFTVDLEVPQPGGRSYDLRQDWYVDALTGAAVPEEDVPDLQRWMRAVAAWKAEQRQTRSGPPRGPAP